MAKTASNKGKSGSGKGKPGGKQSQTGKAPARRADAKPARGKSQQKAKSSKPAEKRGIMKFLRDVRIEMGKVTWPSSRDLMQSTLVVLVAVAIATAYTFGLDEIFSQVVDRIVNLLTS